MMGTHGRREVFTYFEDFSSEDGDFYGDPVPGSTLDVWFQSWAAQGWQPIVLSRQHARQHPLFEDFLAAVSSFPTANNPRYELACYLRWLALDQVQGQLMTDHDVLNFGLAPDDPRLVGLVQRHPATPLVLDVGRVPCAVLLPDESARRAVLDQFMDVAAVLELAEDIEGVSHVSDMTVFQRTRLGVVAGLCDLYTSGLVLRHFASVVSGGPGGKFRLMADSLADGTEANSRGFRSRPPRKHPSTIQWRAALLDVLVDVGDTLLPRNLGRYSSGCARGELEDKAQMLEGIKAEGPQAIDEAWRLVARSVIEAGLTDNLAGDDLVVLLFGRRPGASESWAVEAAQDVLPRLLGSQEWQVRFPALVKASVGRGSWTYFVHLPKTAGSALEAALSLDGPVGSLVRLPKTDSIEFPTHPWLMAQFARHALYDDDPSLTVSGHTQTWHLVRPDSRWRNDRLITLTRSPGPQIISLLNHYLDRSGSPSDLVKSEAESFFSAFGHPFPEGRAEAVDLDLVARGMSVHMANLLPSTYLQRPGLSMMESVVSDGVLLGSSEDLVGFLSSVSPGGLAALESLELTRRVNTSRHMIRFSDLGALQVESLHQSWAPLFLEHSLLSAYAEK